jgi:hypothetical protein
LNTSSLRELRGEASGDRSHYRYMMSDMNNPTECPFNVGDVVRFCPSKRTRGLYQDIGRFGIVPGEERPIATIKDGVYVYFSDGSGGWPWNEFELVRRGNQASE